MSTENTGYSEVNDLGMGRPHVVILGAGASLASFPDGDKNGRRLPLMNDLKGVCGLTEILENYGISADAENFEELYSDLFQSGDQDALRDVEAKIAKYFNDLKLLDGPTIYDLLVISLRPKDLIVTFNWDPFLWQALSRNHLWIDVPNAAFLHGNVAVGFCQKDWKMGPSGTRCPECKKPYQATPLLYPIKQKNYQSNHFIQAEWTKLQRHLKFAYMITVFGYSAPASDVEAIELMRDAYKGPGIRELEQIEIIDIKSEDELRETWSPFVVSHHYQVCSDFQDSWIANHPRRTCDTMWQQLMECRFLDPHHLPITDDWNVIRDWFQPLKEAEKQ